MSDGSRSLDGFVTTARLLGMSHDEIVSALPHGTEAPAWLAAIERAPLREARAALLAAPIARLRVAIRGTRPGWH